MIVLFNDSNREYLRIFAEATEEQKQEGIEVREEDVPYKDGFNTVIYKKDNGVEYKFEEMKEEKSEVEELKDEIAKLKEEQAQSIMELTTMIAMSNMK